MRVSLLLTLLFALLPACSLTGIDQVEATPCATTGTSDLTAAHATCAMELGGAPLGDCEAYVCALQIDDQLFCTVGAPDADGDGVGEAACVPEGTEELRDCDDDDADIAEGRVEICDGKDNDCDGRTDEELIRVTDPVLRDTADSASAYHVVGTATTGDHVTAAFRRDVASNASLFVLAGDLPKVVSRPDGTSGDVRLDAPTTEDQDRGVAVGGDTDTTFVVFPGTGCSGLSAGSVNDPTSSSATLVSTALDDNEGLPSTASANRECTEAVDQRAAAVAVAGRDVMIAWLESSRRGSCGTMATAPLRVTATTPEAQFGSAATDLGTANDSGPPTLLALSMSDVFILAYGHENEIVLSSLRQTGGAIDILDTVRVNVGAPVEDLTLTAGPRGEETTTVAVAFSKGCGRSGEVGLQRAMVTRAGGMIREVGEPTMVDTGEAQVEPAVAFGVDSPRGYFIVWREGDQQVRGQLLDEADGTSGSAVEIVAPAFIGGSADDRIRGIGVAAGTEGGFSTLAYVNGAETGFFESLVSCGAE